MQVLLKLCLESPVTVTGHLSLGHWRIRKCMMSRFFPECQTQRCHRAPRHLSAIKLCALSPYKAYVRTPTTLFYIVDDLISGCKPTWPIQHAISSLDLNILGHKSSHWFLAKRLLQEARKTQHNQDDIFKFFPFIQPLLQCSQPDPLLPIL